VNVVDGALKGCLGIMTKRSTGQHTHFGFSAALGPELTDKRFAPRSWTMKRS
jgi:hypothetical protein